MVTGHIRKAAEILHDEGFSELAKSSYYFAVPEETRYTLSYYGFLFNMYKNKIINDRLYDSYPNPFKPIWVKATQINYRNREPRHPGNGWGLGQVRAGK